MKVTLIGSGGSAVTKKRVCPCFLMDNDLLIDCGPGALRNLRHHDVDLHRVKRLLVSHGHMDHVSDIVPLLWAMRLDERTGPFEILAPDYVLSNVKVLIKRLETPEDFINYPLRLQPLQPGTHSEEIRVAPAAHAITTFAYRVNRDGRSFTYSADTAYSEAVVDLAKGCDLLVHEGTFPDEQADIAKLTTHSTGTQAGSVARLAKVKQLVLFHIPPPNEQYEAKIGEQAGRAFGGPTRVGQDLLEFNL